MNIIRHGVSVGIERVNDNFFLSLKAVGKLTHSDYEMITPLIDSALESVKGPKVDVLIDGTELEGWEPRAAWDDFKLVLKHNNHFRRIAIFGHKRWQKMTAKIGSWFMSGEVKYFEDPAQAIAWLQE